MHLTAASQETVMAAVSSITDATIADMNGHCTIGTTLELELVDGGGKLYAVSVPANAALRFCPDTTLMHGKPALKQTFSWRNHFVIYDLYSGFSIVYKKPPTGPDKFHFTGRTTTKSMPEVDLTRVVPA